MTDDTYQGWANRETWALMLWINNDEGLYTDFRILVADPHKDIYATREEVRLLAETYFTRAGYVDQFGDTWPDGLADAAHEIGSLSRVDWEEVTDALLED